ncbi:MAG: hypothetical protein R3F62_03185 [Planctomycetota bacterium]
MFRTAFLPLLVASAALATHDVAGTWHGRLDVPPSPLALRVELTPGADGWTGALWIPARGLDALPLQGLEVDPGTGCVSFRLAPEDDAPSFSGVLEDGAVRGTFRQGTLELPLSLTREAPPETPARPQTPRGPFPYDAEEVRYAHDGIDLAGTLTSRVELRGSPLCS